MILKNILSNNVNGLAWDWLFQKLTKHYNDRREQLVNSGPMLEPFIFSQTELSQPTCNLLIDLILDDNYPPNSSTDWNELINKSKPTTQQLLLTYLKLDTEKLLNDKPDEGQEQQLELEHAFKHLSMIPGMLLFPHNTHYLATGLWSLDNGHIDEALKHLSKASALDSLPSDILVPYLPNQIVNNLIAAGQSKIALFVHRLLRQNGWDDNYDSIYTYLLLSSNQLIEALKYQRKFADEDGYFERLQNFLEQCSRLNLGKDLNNLRLTDKEERALNYYREAESVMSSRPVTPCASQQSQLNPSQQHYTRSQQKTNPSKNQSSRSVAKGTRTKNVATSSSATPSRTFPVSVTDSPARNTRSARKKKTTY